VVTVQEGYAAQAELVLALRGEAEPPRRRVGALGAVLLALAAVLAVLGLRELASAGESDHPSAWDADVAPLARFVEQTRGLTFDHPVRLRAEVTAAGPGAVVGELDRALLDQHFATAASERPAVAALVDADARRVVAAWVRTLPPAERRALPPAEAPSGPAAVLAGPLVDLAAQQGGNGAVDDLLRTPPLTDEPFLDPWTRLADRQGYLTVAAPEPGGRAAQRERAGTGPLAWLALLSARLPVDRVLTAVDGWGGDAGLTYRDGDAACLAASFRGDTDADTLEMRGALADWAAAGPAGATRVLRRDGVVSLRTCDPAAATSDVPASVLAALVGRARTSAALVRDGVDVPVARCAADRLLRTAAAPRLPLGARAPEVVAAVAACNP
jgi:hypothetical protein